MTLEMEEKKDFKEYVSNIIKSGISQISGIKEQVFFFFCCEMNGLWNFKKSYSMNSALKAFYKTLLHL